MTLAPITVFNSNNNIKPTSSKNVVVVAAPPHPERFTTQLFFMATGLNIVPLHAPAAKGVALQQRTYNTLPRRQVQAATDA